MYLGFEDISKPLCLDYVDDLVLRHSLDKGYISGRLEGPPISLGLRNGKSGFKHSDHDNVLKLSICGVMYLA